MDKKTRNTRQAAKGFNDGYFLMSQTPNVAAFFIKGLEGSKELYARALIAGINRRKIELQLERNHNRTITRIVTPGQFRPYNKSQRKSPSKGSLKNKDRGKSMDDRDL